MMPLIEVFNKVSYESGNSNYNEVLPIPTKLKKNGTAQLSLCN